MLALKKSTKKKPLKPNAIRISINNLLKLLISPIKLFVKS